MESLLEQQRRQHEERERLVDALTKENLLAKKTNREQINSDHRSKILLDHFMDSTDALKEVYEDKVWSIGDCFVALFWCHPFIVKLPCNFHFISSIFMPSPNLDTRMV